MYSTSSNCSICTPGSCFKDSIIFQGKAKEKLFTRTTFKHVVTARWVSSRRQFHCRATGSRLFWLRSKATENNIISQSMCLHLVLLLYFKHIFISNMFGFTQEATTKNFFKPSCWTLFDLGFFNKRNTRKRPNFLLKPKIRAMERAVGGGRGPQVLDTVRKKFSILYQSQIGSATSFNMDFKFFFTVIKTQQNC